MVFGIISGHCKDPFNKDPWFGPGTETSPVAHGWCGTVIKRQLLQSLWRFWCWCCTVEGSPVFMQMPYTSQGNKKKNFTCNFFERPTLGISFILRSGWREGKDRDANSWMWLYRWIDGPEIWEVKFVLFERYAHLKLTKYVKISPSGFSRVSSIWKFSSLHILSDIW